jgi:hypothetical protein
MTYPHITPTTTPDASAKHVVIRFRGLSGAIVAVTEATGKGSNARFTADCAGCLAHNPGGGRYLETARDWAAKHSAECRALPQPAGGQQSERGVDVTVRTTGGQAVTVQGVTNEIARQMEDLPFTARNVVAVEVEQR